MKKFLLAGFAFAVATLGLMACGDNVTHTTEVGDTSIPVVEKGDDFPKCESSNKGVMYYAVDSLAVYYCTGKKWAPVKGDSGKNGEDGEDGTSCTVEKKKNGDFNVFCGDSLMGTLTNSASEITCTADSIKGGYKIVCGGDSVGVVMNGARGEQGEEGDPGEKGDDCSLTDNLDGTVTQVCGEDTVTIYKALCGTEPYDPEGDYFCYGITLYPKCDDKAYDIKTQKCDNDFIVDIE